MALSSAPGVLGVGHVAVARWALGVGRWALGVGRARTWGFLPVRWQSSAPIESLKIRATLHISPPFPDSSPIASSTCVYELNCAAAAIKFNAGSFHQRSPTRYSIRVTLDDESDILSHVIRLTILFLSRLCVAYHACARSKLLRSTFGPSRPFSSFPTGAAIAAGVSTIAFFTSTCFTTTPRDK